MAKRPEGDIFIVLTLGRMKETTVCIIGAGPAGAAAALQLAQWGIQSVIVDKAFFPRDKVCGDGLSGKVITALHRIDPAIAKRLEQYTEKINSWGVTFVSPGRISMDVPYKPQYNAAEDAPIGFVCKRIHFDQFLVDEIKRRPEIAFVQGMSIDQYKLEEDGYILSEAGGSLQIKAKMVIVANGAHSSFTRHIANFTVEPAHHAAGVRAYYRNVTGMHKDNFIELHFLKSLLPGYLWIFPLPNGEANVGLDMLSSAVRKKKVNLKQLLQNTIQEDPLLKERFRDASAVGPVEGYGLPLGSKRRKLAGERYLLTGDAAYLIDPFTGEGIGNALYTGRIAAEHAAAAIKANDFSEEGLAAYTDHVYRVLGAELSLSHKLQKLVKYQWLFNFLMKMCSRNKQMRELISCMFYEVDIRKKLTSPVFYLKVLFNR